MVSNMETIKSQKVAQFFSCEVCDYTTVRSNDWDKHVSTRKHQLETNGNQKVAQACDVCGRQYESRSGLWKHKQLCMPEHNPDTNALIQTLIHEIRQAGPTTHTHVENRVNINVFLHQQCSDAVDFRDFLSNLSITVDDLERTGEEGYIAGMSRLLLSQLSSMDLRQRPIHCADKKRLHFYVRNDDEWSRDKGETVSSAIDEVAQRQIARIKEWEADHPNWTQNPHATAAYLSMVREGMGGATQGERDKNKREVTRVVGEQLYIRDAMLAIQPSPDDVKRV
jgi:hypothetical protein